MSQHNVHTALPSCLLHSQKALWKMQLKGPEEHSVLPRWNPFPHHQSFSCSIPSPSHKALSLARGTSQCNHQLTAIPTVIVRSVKYDLNIFLLISNNLEWSSSFFFFFFFGNFKCDYNSFVILGSIIKINDILMLHVHQKSLISFFPPLYIITNRAF